MPRAPRILIEGGLYHVYNRFARGEEVFADPEEAITFLDLLRELKQRDDLQVLACAGLGIVTESLAGKLKDRRTMTLRQLVATVGIERWNQRAGKLGGILGKHPDVVSRWARAGAERRSSDHEFAEGLDQLDATLAESCRHKTKIV
jgi:hypothetical protein